MRLPIWFCVSREARPLVRIDIGLSKGGEKNEGVVLSTPCGDRTGGCDCGGGGDCGRAWWDFWRFVFQAFITEPFCCREM